MTQAAKTKPKLEPLSRRWPAVKMYGCSVCGAVSSAGASNHWCEPVKDWMTRWDTYIKYDAVAEAKP